MDANVYLQRILLGNKSEEEERKGGRKGEVVNKIQPPLSHPQRLTSCHLVQPPKLLPLTSSLSFYQCIRD